MTDAEVEAMASEAQGIIRDYWHGTSVRCTETGMVILNQGMAEVLAKHFIAALDKHRADYGIDLIELMAKAAALDDVKRDARERIGDALLAEDVEFWVDHYTAKHRARLSGEGRVQSSTT